MPLLFRRAIGKEMYGSTHLGADVSVVGEASEESLLPPRASPTHRASSDRWKRDAFFISCLAFGMAALAGLLGAYIIFVRDRSQPASIKASIRSPVYQKSELPP